MYPTAQTTLTSVIWACFATLSLSCQLVLASVQHWEGGGAGLGM